MEFEQVYDLYFRDVYRYILKLSGSEHVAEEITSDTFFKALRSIGKFRGSCRHAGMAVPDRQELLLHLSCGRKSIPLRWKNCRSLWAVRILPRS